MDPVEQALKERKEQENTGRLVVCPDCGQAMKIVGSESTGFRLVADGEHKS